MGVRRVFGCLQQWELFPSRDTLHGQSWNALTGRKLLALPITQHRRKQSVHPVIHSSLHPRGCEPLPAVMSFTMTAGHSHPLFWD